MFMIRPWGPGDLDAIWSILEPMIRAGRRIRCREISAERTR